MYGPGLKLRMKWLVRDRQRERGKKEKKRERDGREREREGEFQNLGPASENLL